MGQTVNSFIKDYVRLPQEHQENTRFAARSRFFHYNSHLCKTPDIKCILLVFPRSSFYKNKKHMKTFPAVIPTVHQAAVPPAHPPLPMLLHMSFREVWLPPGGHLPSLTCFSAFQPGSSSEFHDSSTQGEWG